MILYISEHCQHVPTFDSTHLNKILHYSDFLQYGLTGRAISNETYIRQEFGPVPRHLSRACQELESEGKLTLDEDNAFEKTQKRPVVTATSYYSRLTYEQKELIDRVINAVVGLAANNISE